MKFVHFLLLSGLVTSGCTWKKNATQTPVMVDADVIFAYSDYEHTMKKARTPLEFDFGRSATNCKEYFEYRKVSTVTETSRNFVAAQEYVICETIQLIRKSQNNKTDIRNDVDFSDDMLSKIDLRSFRSSLFQRTDDEHYTLDKLFPGPHKTTPYNVQPSIEDWNYQVQIVARIDANNNGKEDWLVWVRDTAESGSYDTLQAWIAYDIDNSVLIELSPIHNLE